MNKISRVRTISGFIQLGGKFRLMWRKYPSIGDEWTRRDCKIGWLFVSWSIAT